MKRLTEMSSDEYNAGIIAEAVRFTASRKSGVGTYDTREAPTQPEAEAMAEQMGRGTIIYAINAAGRQAFVKAIR